MDEKMVLRRPTPSRPTMVRPSCPALVSTFFTEQETDSDCRSFSQLLAGAMASSPPAGGSSAWSTPAVCKETGTGIAVRPKTVRIKSMHPTAIPILPRSPYLDVSAGSTSSASALVDSPGDPRQTPAMATQSEPGNFPASPFVPGVSEAAGSDSTKEKILKQDGGSNVVFKPLAKVGTRNPLSPLANFGPFGISHQQALAQVQAQAQAEVYSQAHAQIQAQSASSPSPVSSSAATSPQPQVPSSFLAASSALVSATASNYIPSQQMALIQPETKQTIESPKPGPQTIEQIQRSLPPIPVGDRPSYDGYNWRKYGQKQVKGSEYPRSYYKCTHPNCPVKKKVERSHDGQVTEIVYKGEHNHLKPQPARRLATGAHPYVSDVNGQDMSSPGHGSSDKNESLDVKVDLSSPGFTVDPRGRNERIINISDPSTPVRGHGSPERSFGLSDDEDGSRADDGDDDEPDSKRRRKEKKVKDLVALRIDQEPRVVLRTTTDADILEDGFRWRKYGQKVVKGNPHPRSYYKCTSVKCTVRKHVERASNDPKAVITTYEGKHNHDAPVASAKKLQP